MKTYPAYRFMAMCGLWLATLSVLAQGSLTPIGAPGPTMVTLQQIEPRVPISGATTITNPGSYYLTGNISVPSGSGIIIQTNNVTLDLNGFTITSAAPGGIGTAILMEFCQNVRIFNGHIASGVAAPTDSGFNGNGFAYGILDEQPNYNVYVSRVAVTGVRLDGINIGGGVGTVVDSCNVLAAGGVGILADSVANSVALQCGGTAIDASVVQNCYGTSYNDDGIRAACSALNSSGYGGIGVSANQAENCYGSSPNGDGLDIATVALNCSGSGTFHGLVAATAQNCFGSSTGHGPGIEVVVAENCNGISAYDSGIRAMGGAQNCVGSCTNVQGEDGIDTANANNCQGSSVGGIGISASQSATGCTGMSTSGPGIFAEMATTCYGYSVSGPGIQVDTAIGCTGISSSSIGVDATIAQCCYGISTTGAGLYATIANSCVATGSPAFNVTYKYNMP